MAVDYSFKVAGETDVVCMTLSNRKKEKYDVKNAKTLPFDECYPKDEIENASLKN